MDNYQHLLSKHGILVTFNIAKKIKPSEIKSIRKKLESKFQESDKLEKEINKEIKAKTQKFLQENDIPGLIQKGGETFDKIYINKKIQTKILKLANKVVDYCKQYNFTKEHVIFFMQAVLHLLKISNEDMQKFKEKYNINQDPSDDYLDEEEDDDDED
jgi:hypothetical protein